MVVVVNDGTLVHDHDQVQIKILFFIQLQVVIPVPIQEGMLKFPVFGKHGKPFNQYSFKFLNFLKYIYILSCIPFKASTSWASMTADVARKIIPIKIMVLFFNLLTFIFRPLNSLKCFNYYSNFFCAIYIYTKF